MSVIILKDKMFIQETSKLRPTLFHLVLFALATLQRGVCSLTYTQYTDTCTASLLQSWARPSLHDRKGRLQIECARDCARDPSCSIPVSQMFQDGSAECDKLSNMGQVDDLLNAPSPGSCSVITVGCKNGARLVDAVCSCGDLFTGELCDKPNPGFCTRDWGLVANVYNTGSMDVVDTERYASIRRKQPKVQFMDNGTTVTFDPSRVVFQYAPLRMISHARMEKTQWNRYASSPARQFLYYRVDGWMEEITYDSISNDFDSVTSITDFKIFSSDEEIFTVKIAVDDPGPDRWTVMKEALEDGAQLWEFNTASVQDNSVLIAQQTDMCLAVETTVTPRTLWKPDKWFQHRQEFKRNSENRDELEVYLGQGLMDHDSESPLDWWLSPCWSKLTKGTSSSPTERLGNYLGLGHKVRARVDDVWFDVLSVIRVGGEFSIMLAPYVEGGWTARLNWRSDTGVKTLLSTAGHTDSCEYEMEVEQVEDQTTTPGVDYSIYHDTRKWQKVCSVKSDATVVYGSESSLASGVLSGRDVRVMIEWSNEDRSWYLDTHTNTVTPTGQVSSETVTTWAVEDRFAASMTLNSLCDYETVMVTSEGHVEIVKYNSQSDGQVTQLTGDDIMITWFLQ